MTWARFDDGFDENPKIDGLSDGAFRLYVTGIVVSARNLTDGRIAAVKVRRLTPNFEPGHLSELESGGLWERDGDEWVIHDFLDYNPSREQVFAERERRSSAGQKAANARWDAKRNANRMRTASAIASEVPMHPSRPDPTPIPITSSTGLEKAYPQDDGDFAAALKEARRQAAAFGDVVDVEAWSRKRAMKLVADGWKPEPSASGVFLPGTGWVAGGPS